MSILIDVKYTILLLIAAVFFSSCDLTKRRYMPGYLVEWNHKSLKTNATKEPVIVRNTASPLIEPIAAKELNIIPAPAVKWSAPARLKPVNIIHHKKIVSTHIATNSNVVMTSVSAINQVDKGQPHFYTGDEQEDDHARKSLIYGILSLGCPAAGFLILLGLVLSVGTTLATPPTYALVIFLLGCTGGLLFAIFAIINGFLAINEINAQPDTYSGTGEAITGMLLAALVPIGIAAYLLIRFL